MESGVEKSAVFSFELFFPPSHDIKLKRLENGYHYRDLSWLTELGDL